MSDMAGDLSWLFAYLRTPPVSPVKRDAHISTSVDRHPSSSRFPLSSSRHSPSPQASPFRSTSFSPTSFPERHRSIQSFLSSYSGSDSSGSSSQLTLSTFSLNNIFRSPTSPTSSLVPSKLQGTPLPTRSQKTYTPSFRPSPDGQSLGGFSLFRTPFISPKHTSTPGTSPVEHSSRPRARKNPVLADWTEEPARGRSVELWTGNDSDNEDDEEVDSPNSQEFMARLLDSARASSVPPSSSPGPFAGSPLPTTSPPTRLSSIRVTSGSRGFPLRGSSASSLIVSPFSSPLSLCSSGSDKEEDIPLIATLRAASCRTSGPLSPITQSRKRKSDDQFHYSSTKRARTTKPTSALPTYEISSGTTGTDSGQLTNSQRRTFPSQVPVDDGFPLFYRRFPISSHTQIGDRLPKLPGATFNPPRNVLDLYTPRFTKGIGRTKVGVCPVCAEPRARGGEGTVTWLSMKFSAFKCYHVQYAHGISALTGLPFSPPVAFRTVSRPKASVKERRNMRQAKCHKCQKWVDIESIKEIDAKVKELFWWKHAAACHRGSTISGESNIYVEDRLHREILAATTD